MWKYVLKRLVSIIPIMLGAMFIVFVIMDLAPGDATDLLLSADTATEEEREELRVALGLDKPVPIQFLNYVINLCKGDLGTSYKSGAPVIDEMIQRVPYTVMLALAATIIKVIVSIPLGMLAAIKQNTVFDSATMAICLVGVSMPAFWLALMLILLFSVNLGWLPVSGSGSIQHLILPALTQSFAGIASIARVTRSSMLEVVRQDYVRTARAKGLPERVVIWRHSLKNALLPTVTVIGGQIANLLAGGVLTETVFAWPGIGRFLMNSISWRDTPCVMACVMMFVLAFAVINLIVDILYGFIDPRIKGMYVKK